MAFAATTLPMLMFRSMKLLQLSVSLALAATAAQGQTAPGSAKPASPTAAAKAPLASGEVLEVNRQEQRVLLKHGPIQSIGMDAMTMEFLVPDGKLLASLKPGDRVRFAAAWKDGDYVVTRIEVLKRRGSKRSESRTAP